jgi:hypothetical protein
VNVVNLLRVLVADAKVLMQKMLKFCECQLVKLNMTWQTLKLTQEFAVNFA